MTSLQNNYKPELHVGTRTEWMHLLLLFALSFALYAWSSPRTLAFEDDGLFVMASYFNGIAHPPGYPLFTLLGHLATFIPVGSIAYRVHMVSALFGALSCVMMYKIALFIFQDRTYAYIAGACLAISREFWSQAIISEVYTLNVFILLALILFALYQADNDRPFSRKLLYLMAFVYGLGLCDHWPLLILTSPAILLILWPVRREVLLALPRSIPFLLLGLTPYVWLVIRSHMDPVISFYSAIDSWKEFWYMVSRQGYARTDVDVGANIWDKLDFSRFVLKETSVQLGLFGLLFIIVGFVRQWRVWKPSFCFALLFGYLGSTFILIGLLGFNFDVLHQNVFRVYPVNAYTIMVLWLCLGVRYVSRLLANLAGRHLKAVSTGNLLGVLVIGTGLLSNIPYNHRAEDHLAQEYAHVVLKSLAPNAVFFTLGDIDTFTLGYFHLVEGVRPDVELYNIAGLVFPTRLFKPMFVSEKTRYKSLKDFIDHETRPIYYLQDLPKIYGYRYYGPYSKLDKSLAPDKANLVVDPEIINFYERLLNSGYSYDHWERMVQNSMLADYCKIVSLYSEGDKQADINEQLRVCKGYSSLMVLLDFQLARKPTPDSNLLQDLLQRARKLRSQANTIRDFIMYDVLYGRFLLLQNQRPEALQHFQTAIKLWPDTHNPAYQLIQEKFSPAGNGAPVPGTAPPAPPTGVRH
jgi:tetratricopeptide (TPR) repeat protein